jgi:hypothetical protein
MTKIRELNAKSKNWHQKLFIYDNRYVYKIV